MAMEVGLNSWMSSQIEGEVIAAVGYRQSASLIALERHQTSGSSEVRLNLHIYQWFKSLIGTGNEKNRHFKVQTCFGITDDERQEFGANDALNVELSLSKNEDLIACVIDGNVYGRLYS